MDTLSTPKNEKKPVKKLADMTDEELTQFYQDKLAKLKQQKAKIIMAVKRKEERKSPKINHAKFILVGEFIKKKEPTTAKLLLEEMAKTPKTYSEQDCKCLELLCADMNVKLSFIPKDKISRSKEEKIKSK